MLKNLLIFSIYHKTHFESAIRALKYARKDPGVGKVLP